MTRVFLAAAAAYLAMTAFGVVTAFAAEVTASGGALTVPWGAFVAELSRAAFEILEPLIVAGIMAAVARLFPALSLFVTNAFVDRMVRRAGDYALNAVEGAAKGKAVTVAIGPDVLAEGVAQAINTTVPWVAAKAGGTQGIAQRLFRHLDFEPAASNENVLQPALEALAAKAA